MDVMVAIGFSEELELSRGVPYQVQNPMSCTSPELKYIYITRRRNKLIG